MSFENEEQDPTIEQVITLALEQKLMEVHTALPAEVVDFDPDTRTGTVLLGVQRRVAATKELKTIPPVSNVPFVFPGGAKGRLTIPPTKGDPGLVVFSERAIGTWLDRDGAVDPEDGRKFHYSDAVFIPGIDLLGSVTPVDMTATVLDHDDTVKVGANASDFAALAGLVLSELQAIKVAFDIHTHTVPIVGPAGTTPTTPPLTGLPSPGSVAASKAKVE